MEKQAQSRPSEGALAWWKALADTPGITEEMKACYLNGKSFLTNLTLVDTNYQHNNYLFYADDSSGLFFVGMDGLVIASPARVIILPHEKSVLKSIIVFLGKFLVRR